MRTPACSGDSPCYKLGCTQTLEPSLIPAPPPRDCASGTALQGQAHTLDLSSSCSFCQNSRCSRQHQSVHGSPPGPLSQRSVMMGTISCRVLRAVPVQEISIEDGSINVEMDPEDQFQAVQSLERMNMQ